MSNTFRAILYGFLIWLFAFVIAFAIFPIHESWRALFESIMPVAISLISVVLANRYLRQVDAGIVRESVKLGVIWFSISFVIDLPLMLTGPIGMSFTEYLGDIAFTYLMIPVITVGVGVAMNNGFRRSGPEQESDSGA